MSCDADFGHISQKLKGTIEVFQLETYVNLFKDALKNSDVVKILRHNFYDVKKVVDWISIKKKDNGNRDVSSV